MGEKNTQTAERQETGKSIRAIMILQRNLGLGHALVSISNIAALRVLVGRFRRIYECANDRREVYDCGNSAKKDVRALFTSAFPSHLG